jgi:ubiquinone/menaquinone biosynthesis C-methylase UbiE
MQSFEVERLFSGQLGAEYAMLKLICPAAAEMSQRVGAAVAGWNPGTALEVYEIGCGTGITSECLLQARGDIVVTAIDNEPAMLAQARANLASWLEQGRLRLLETDALSGLAALPESSVDVVASGYVVHNFLQGYRAQVLEEIYRVLKPGGVFVNGDRYALDDTAAHTRLTQDEARHWFQAFAAIGRYDLLEQWIIHLFSDESEDHIMRLAPALSKLAGLGFDPVAIPFRAGVNTLVVATKPAP